MVQMIGLPVLHLLPPCQVAIGRSLLPWGSLLFESEAAPGPSQPQFSEILLLSPESQGVHRSWSPPQPGPRCAGSKELPLFREALEAPGRGCEI